MSIKRSNTDNITHIFKVCTKCNLNLPHKDFAKTNRYPLGLEYWCYSCRAKYAEDRRKSGKGDRTIFAYLKRLLYYVKREAAKRKIDFEITIDQVIELYGKQQGLCALSGEKLTWEFYNGRVLTNISVDRIDSDKDYTIDNIQLVCYIVNTMKNILIKEELLEWCSKILNNNNKTITNKE